MDSHQVPIPISPENPLGLLHFLFFLAAIFVSIDINLFLRNFFVLSIAYYVLHVIVPYAIKLIMEAKALETLAALQNANTSVDNKVGALQVVKSEIKQRRVPEPAVAPLFESTRLAIAAPHSNLASAGFSTLGHLLKRLYIQGNEVVIAINGRQFYPLLLERLGDHRERLRIQSSQAFTDFWPASPSEVEHHVLGIALTGRNPRAKEMSMAWLCMMTREHSLKFRIYVPSLISSLEDADSGVRDVAKNTVIELFSSAPPRALADLRQQLAERNVRRSIASVILSSLHIADPDLSSSSRAVGPPRPTSSMSTSRRDEPARPNSALSTRAPSRLDRAPSRMGRAAEDEAPQQRPGSSQGEPPRPALSHSRSAGDLSNAASAADQEHSDVIPLMVRSNREIDDLIRNMLPHFEGRETEHNWIPRDKAIATFRSLAHGNAPRDFPQHFYAGLKSLLDGIVKVVNSLRTTLSTNGCILVQDLARICGSGLDPSVELLLQTFIKLCGGMKKISHENGNVTVDTILQHVSYTPRLLQHVWFACQDKNVQPRLYATGWLKTLLAKQSRHKNSLEHGGGFDLVEKCIKKGLTDANPGVREGMRATFWAYHQGWPDRAAQIMASLDNKTRTMLEKDPANPNSSSSTASKPAVQGFSKSVSAATGRQTLKDSIAAQKRRMAASQNLPPRPESAQSTFAETKPTRPPARAATSQSTTQTLTVPTGASLSSLSSAPMRPGSRARRPEPPRPATADPYADRRRQNAMPRSGTTSTDSSPSKAKSTSATTPRSRTPARPKSRLGAAPTSPAKNKPKKLDISSSRSGDTHGRDDQPRSDSDDILRAQPSVEEGVLISPTEGSSEEKINIVLPDSDRGADGSEDQAVIADVIPGPSPEQAVETPDTMAHAEAASQSVEEVPMETEQVNSPAIVEETAPTAISVEDAPPTPMSDQPGGGDVMAPTSPPLDDPTSGQGALQTTVSSESQEEEAALSPPGLPHGVPQTPSGASETVSAELASTERTPDKSLPAAHNPDASQPAAAELASSVQLKVYEDPASPIPPEKPPGDREEKSPDVPQKVNGKPVLEELPLNEPNALANRTLKFTPSPDRGSVTGGISPEKGKMSNGRLGRTGITERRRSVSPRLKDPAKARMLVDKGIPRVRNYTLDVHGYRKLQGIIRYHDQLFDENKYCQMLLALLDALEDPQSWTRSPGLGKPLEVKSQILATIRLMLSYNQGWFSTHYTRALTALIQARKHYEVNNHAVSGLEEAVETIVSSCQPLAAIDTVLNVLDKETMDENGSRVIIMGNFVLSGLVQRLARCEVPLDRTIVDRLGKWAHRSLTEGSPDIRRSVTQLCVSLRPLFEAEEDFWRAIDYPSANDRNLLTYYIVRGTTLDGPFVKS